jgi:hypothetical protein
MPNIVHKIVPTGSVCLCVAAITGWEIKVGAGNIVGRVAQSV